MQETVNWQDAAALERFQMISPLLDPDMDNAKRIQLRREIASNHNLSERTIYRYEKGYRENAFAGLRPMNRKMRRSARLPDNWDEIVGEAIILKREVPRRSARQIIKILEIEGWAPPGIVKESTLRRYLFKAGLGVKQMRRYAEARETSSRRFCRLHRMELLQADYPDVSFIPIFSAAQRNNALDKRKHRDKISYNRPYAFLKSTSDISLTSDSFLRRGWFWSVAASIAFLFISVSAYA